MELIALFYSLFWTGTGYGDSRVALWLNYDIIVAHTIFNFRVQDLLSSVFPTFLPK